MVHIWRLHEDSPKNKPSKQHAFYHYVPFRNFGLDSGLLAKAPPGFRRRALSLTILWKDPKPKSEAQPRFRKKKNILEGDLLEKSLNLFLYTFFDSF